MSEAAAWGVPALLGAYHGLNPAMGWLFAVALGLQQRSATAVMRALPPIALGHAVSVSITIAAVAGARLFIPAGLLRIVGAGVLFGYGALLLRRRAHPRWVGMRLGFRDLTLWSFLMSSAHGAGLMLLPLLIASAPSPGVHAAHGALSGVSALSAHTAAMFAVMAAAALAAFRAFDLGFLRRAWLNFDAFWIGALFVAGIVTLMMR